ncbi:group-specific protein [Brevibacillus dissolubilis]|uniref:group-specific protein n=1 Tax=Brevibacillus dissolubilis TaxID=1844116 RepID=UPI0011167729|nr:group-specific protein [Brevibacillus dissolubilis]
MSECKLDHTREDVQKKCVEQSAFLPADIHTSLKAYLEKDLPQATLNEVFHLLKKYDLADAEQRAARDEKLRELLGS